MNSSQSRMDQNSNWLLHYGIAFIAIISVAILYGWHEMVFMPPKGVHIWRQTDTLSIAYMIYKKWASLWHPQPLRIGPHDIPEFPWLSFLLAQLWYITGYHEWFYRLSVALLWIASQIMFFSITLKTNRSLWKSLVFTLFLFSSPLISYYGCNYLPDVAALSLIIIGWSAFLHRIDSGKWLWTLIGSLSFLGAVLLKASHMLSLGALGGSLFLIWLFEKQQFKYLDIVSGLFIAGVLGIHGIRFHRSGVQALVSSITCLYGNGIM